MVSMCGILKEYSLLIILKREIELVQSSDKLYHNSQTVLMERAKVTSKGAYSGGRFCES